MNKIRVTIWNEYLHEKDDPGIAEIYPEGIHGAIKKELKMIQSSKSVLQH